MRTVKDIDRDIQTVLICLENLRAEREVLEHLNEVKQAHAALFTELAIEKAKKND